jgi:hypothetical protein
LRARLRCACSRLSCLPCSSKGLVCCPQSSPRRVHQCRPRSPPAPRQHVRRPLPRRPHSSGPRLCVPRGHARKPGWQLRAARRTRAPCQFPDTEASGNVRKCLNAQHTHTHTHIYIYIYIYIYIQRRQQQTWGKETRFSIFSLRAPAVAKRFRCTTSTGGSRWTSMVLAAVRGCWHPGHCHATSRFCDGSGVQKRRRRELVGIE